MCFKNSFSQLHHAFVPLLVTGLIASYQKQGLALAVISYNCYTGVRRKELGNMARGWVQTLEIEYETFSFGVFCKTIAFRWNFVRKARASLSPPMTDYLAISKLNTVVFCTKLSETIMKSGLGKDKPMSGRTLGMVRAKTQGSV
jgi:hypothetical protein